MKVLWSSIWCLLMLPLVASAERPDILVPEQDAEFANELVANSQFIQKELYFAKRWRVVRVNTDLLLSDQTELSLPLFDSTAIPVTRDKLEERNARSTFTWYGHCDYKSFSLESFITFNPQRSEDEARRLYNNLVGVQITGERFVYDEDPAQSVALSGMHFDNESGRFVYERERHGDLEDRGTVVYDVRFDLRPVLPPSARPPGQQLGTVEYRLRSMPVDRKYAILYEVDEAKLVPRIEVGAIPTPEQSAKIERYRRHLEALEKDSPPKDMN